MYVIIELYIYWVLTFTSSIIFGEIFQASFRPVSITNGSWWAKRACGLYVVQDGDITKMSETNLEYQMQFCL